VLLSTVEEVLEVFLPLSSNNSKVVQYGILVPYLHNVTPDTPTKGPGSVGVRYVSLNDRR
jgi:hypothetical protein